MIHELKIMPEYFEAVASGRKTFEVRRCDRLYTDGDTLRLKEYNGHCFTGRELSVLATYILRDRNYCKDGFCIIGFVPIIPGERLSIRSIPVDGGTENDCE